MAEDSRWLNLDYVAVMIKPTQIQRHTLPLKKREKVHYITLKVLPQQKCDNWFKDWTQIVIFFSFNVVKSNDNIYWEMWGKKSIRTHYSSNDEDIITVIKLSE